MSLENFPPTWEPVKLGEVSSIVMGQSPPSTTYNEEGDGLSFLQGKAEFAEVFPVAVKFCNKPLKVAKEGSVLISVRAPVGDVNLADRDYIIGRGLASIKLKKGDKWFLFYLLLHSKKKINSQGTGTTFQSINRTVLDNFPIHLPPLHEQRAIARALRAVQEAREARRREAALERERKAALMDYLFTHGTHGEPRQKTEIGEIPKSWRVFKLGSVVKVKGGKRLPKGADFSKEPTEFPYIRIVDFLDGSVKKQGLKYVSKELHAVIKNYTISKDDIYISIAGTIGIVGTIPPELDGANLTENAAKLVILSNGTLDKDFAARYLSGNIGQIQISNLTTKTTQPKLALTRIEQIKIPIPEIEEQKEIAKALSACDAKIAALEQEAAVLEELFRAMLEELMTGRLLALPLVEAEGTA